MEQYDESRSIGESALHNYTTLEKERGWPRDTVLTLIIGTVKNNYYHNRLALNRMQINYPRGVFNCIRADSHGRCPAVVLASESSSFPSLCWTTAKVNLSSMFSSSLSPLKHFPTCGTHTFWYIWNPQTAEENANSSFSSTMATSCLRSCTSSCTCRCDLVRLNRMTK